MSVIEYDKAVPIATNHKSHLQIVKYGTKEGCWRFYLNLTGKFQDGFETGEKFNTKGEILKASREMALSSLCDCFTVDHLSSVVTKDCYVNILKKERAALIKVCNVSHDKVLHDLLKRL